MLGSIVLVNQLALVDDVANNNATKPTVPSTGGRMGAYKDATEKTFQDFSQGLKI